MLEENEYFDVERIRYCNDIISGMWDRSQPKNCAICKKQVKGFCNSHSVPKFILKNIGTRGQIYDGGSLVNIFPDILDKTYLKGINNTGTFKLICRDCDNKYFVNYEDESGLRNINDRVCNEIVLKNALKTLADKFFEKEAEKYAFENHEVHLPHSCFWNQDYTELTRTITRILKAFNNKKVVSYKVLYNRIVDYVVPVAFQGEIVIDYDLHGHIINDTLCEDIHNLMQGVNLVVFPLKSQSLILLFYDKSYDRLKPFDAQFSRLEEKQQLEIMNYLIFKFTGYFYIHSDTAKILRKDEQFLEVCQDADLHSDDSYGVREIKQKKMNLLKKIPNIPNLLLPEWAIK